MKLKTENITFYLRIFFCLSLTAIWFIWLINLPGTNIQPKKNKSKEPEDRELIAEKGNQAVENNKQESYIKKEEANTNSSKPDINKKKNIAEIKKTPKLILPEKITSKSNPVKTSELPKLANLEIAKTEKGNLQNKKEEAVKPKIQQPVNSIKIDLPKVANATRKVLLSTHQLLSNQATSPNISLRKRYNQPCLFNQVVTS